MQSSLRHFICFQLDTKTFLFLKNTNTNIRFFTSDLNNSTLTPKLARTEGSGQFWGQGNSFIFVYYYNVIPMGFLEISY